MNKKVKKSTDGLVYSTDDSLNLHEAFEEEETLTPNLQKLNIRLETKQRGGKKATIVRGFVGKMDDLETLSKKLKSHCGTGGSIVDGEILIQGDMSQKVKAYLQNQGYKTNNI
jgi:translation initiation factor 1